MFSLFLELPIEIRRKIWLATLGPTTLTFTSKEQKTTVYDESDARTLMWNTGEWHPEWLRLVDSTGHASLLPDPETSLDDPEDAGEEMNAYANEDGCPNRIVPRRSLFANYTRYFGHVVLADGSSRLQFVVKSSAAYRACKESRAFLRFIFAEPVRPGGGLPSWFRFDIDTIGCTNFDFYVIRNHAWFRQTQHLMITIRIDTSFYFEMGGWSDDPDGDERNETWIKNNLPSLRYITFVMEDAKPAGGKCSGEWLYEWIELFEEWYNYPDGSEPPSFYAQVISHQVPEEEWLTPTNYLRVYKFVVQKFYQAHFPDGDWKSHVQNKRKRDILESTDEELENPTRFLEKHRPLWDT